MLEHRGGLEPQMVGRWDRKREKLFRKKYSQRLVKVADREKKKIDSTTRKKLPVLIYLKTQCRLRY